MLEIVKKQTSGEKKENYIGWNQTEVASSCCYTSLREFYLVKDADENITGFKSYDFKFNSNDGSDLRKEYHFDGNRKTNITFYEFSSEQQKKMFIKLASREEVQKKSQFIIF